MDAYVSDATLQALLRIQPFVELTFSVPSFLTNLYFAMKFGSLSQYSPNLRILMITTNLFCSLMSILHPILAGLPREIYSIEKGHYFFAFVVYLMAFTTHICALIIDVKYLLIGLERKYAFSNRQIYESLDGSLARRFFLIVLPIACAIICLKIGGILYNEWNKHKDVDLLLASAFFLEQSPVTCSIMDVLGAICVVYGLTVVFLLDRKAKNYKFTGRSLSESYQIKEVTSVIGILKPLIYAYACMSSSCSSFLFPALYLVLFGGHSTYSHLYLALTNSAYITIAAYNFIATLYLLWHFEPLKRALLKDIRSATGIQFNMPVAIVPHGLNLEKQDKEHFDYLKNAWA